MISYYIILYYIILYYIILYHIISYYTIYYIYISLYISLHIIIFIIIYIIIYIYYYIYIYILYILYISVPPFPPQEQNKKHLICSVEELSPEGRTEGPPGLLAPHISSAILNWSSEEPFNFGLENLVCLMEVYLTKSSDLPLKRVTCLRIICWILTFTLT